MPPLELQKAMARFVEIWWNNQPCRHCLIGSHPYHALALLHIDFVADDDLLQYQSSVLVYSGARSHTNGKLSGSMGLAWMRNSSRQLSSVSKLLALLTS